MANAILAEFDVAEALQLISELGLGWADPITKAERERALGIKGLTPERAIAKVSRDLRGGGKPVTHARG